MLASSGLDDRVLLWDVALESWTERAYAIANRNLSCNEWHEHMGAHLNRKTCEKLPWPNCPWNTSIRGNFAVRLGFNCDVFSAQTD